MGREWGSGINLGLIQGYVDWCSGISLGIDRGLWGESVAVALLWDSYWAMGRTCGSGISLGLIQGSGETVGHWD